MKTNGLAKTSLVDDGECLSFFTFSPGVDTSSFIYSGYELLMLPDADHTVSVAGENFAMRGPQILLLGPGLEHGWSEGDFVRGDLGEVAVGRPGLSEGDAGREDLSEVGAGRGDFSEGGESGAGMAIRWPEDLLGDGFREKTQTKAISELLEKAAFGVRLDPGVFGSVRRRLKELQRKAGFSIYLGLLELLHELSRAQAETLLCVLPARIAGAAGSAEKKSGIDEVVELMQANYFRPMTLEEMARKACMTKGSFCRGFRKKTGKTYAETLNEIRLGHICRLLAETTDTVSEIAYRSGYNNIHHFHRHFKRQKGCTPLQYRGGLRG